MSAKVLLRSVDQKSVEKVKRSAADAMVRQLVCVKLDTHLYQRIRTRPTGEIESSPNSYIPWGLEPSIDAKIGVFVQAPILANQIRFRPIADQRSHPAY